jgi:hypothetical protein
MNASTIPSATAITIQTSVIHTVTQSPARMDGSNMYAQTTGHLKFWFVTTLTTSPAATSVTTTLKTCSRLEIRGFV